MSISLFQGKEPSTSVLCSKMTALKAILVVLSSEVDSEVFHASREHGYFGLLGFNQ